MILELLSEQNHRCLGIASTANDDEGPHFAPYGKRSCDRARSFISEDRILRAERTNMAIRFSIHIPKEAEGNSGAIRISLLIYIR